MGLIFKASRVGELATKRALLDRASSGTRKHKVDSNAALVVGVAKQLEARPENDERLACLRHPDNKLSRPPAEKEEG